MQLKQKLAYIALGCMIPLSGVVLLINVQAQAPEEAQIVFQSNRDGNWRSDESEIYVMDTDGGNKRRLTNNPGLDYMPRWSPDGQRIVFAHADVKGGWFVPESSEIYVMDADGSNQRNLTNSPEADQCPAWSPDGQRIAFASYRDGSYRDFNGEIYVMDADGSNPRRLTNNLANDWGPNFSPDGQRIAFTSWRDGNEELYVMDADGSNQRNLTNSPASRDGWQEWSPDGQKIAFDTNRDGNFEIYVMDADGKNQRNLTNNPADDWVGAWSPDGQRMAFWSGRDGNHNVEIYVMDADGDNLRRLTNHPGWDHSPDWFDPAFARIITPVSPAGKLRSVWGWLKQSSE